MMTAQIASTDRVRSSTAVQAMLRDIGYVLWLSRMMAKEIESQKNTLARPEMFECCEFETAECAA